jgi:hypothetical protein
MNLLEMAFAEVEARQQWYNGESVVIWRHESGNANAYVKNYGGELVMHLRVGKKHSKGIDVGWLDYLKEGGAGWSINRTAHERYPQWIEVAKEVLP